MTIRGLASEEVCNSLVIEDYDCPLTYSSRLGGLDDAVDGVQNWLLLHLAKAAELFLGRPKHTPFFEFCFLDRNGATARSESTNVDVGGCYSGLHAYLDEIIDQTWQRVVAAVSRSRTTTFPRWNHA